MEKIAANSEKIVAIALESKGTIYSPTQIRGAKVVTSIDKFVKKYVIGQNSANAGKRTLVAIAAQKVFKVVKPLVKKAKSVSKTSMGTMKQQNKEQQK